MLSGFSRWKEDARSHNFTARRGMNSLGNGLGIIWMFIHLG